MRIKNSVMAAAVILGLAWSTTVEAQQWALKGKVLAKTPAAAATGDVESVLFNWMWHVGILRGPAEVESLVTFELGKATGTIRVGGQTCKLTNYRASMNYQESGMREQYTCTLPDGRSHQGIASVREQFAWDDDSLGAGLVPGRGTATPTPSAVHERLIRLWSGPWGAIKAAAMGHDNGKKTTVALEGGKPVVTYPIPGVPGATAKATLNSMSQAERVEVRHGSNVTEFTYDKYADYNPEDDRIDGYFAGRLTEKRDGATVLDLNVVETHVGNLYVIVPVPESVRTAWPAQR